MQIFARKFVVIQEEGKKMRVKDCMCGEVCWVKPDTKVSEIAKIMNQNHIGCVPVCDDKNSLVGIITDRDIILRTIACDKDVNTTKKHYAAMDENRRRMAAKAVKMREP